MSDNAIRPKECRRAGRPDARATAALGRMPAVADPTLYSLKNDVPGWQKQLDDLELQIVKAAKERN